MAGARPPKPPVSLPDNVVLMEDMALYAERIDLQGMMQEYLRRWGTTYPFGTHSATPPVFKYGTRGAQT